MAKAPQGFVISDEDLKRFQREYYECINGKYNLDVQVPYLLKLADGYFSRYKSSHNWTDMLKAHALYNSVSFRHPANERFKKQAYEVQREYWKGAANMNYDDQQAFTALLRDRLQQTRESIRQKLKGLSAMLEESSLSTNACADLQNNFCESVKHISVECTDKMLELSHKIIEHSVEVLNQEPPCDFCAVAIGSMAKGEATPYSDLEYLFIIQEKNEFNIRYFETLAITSYLFMGNLQETKLSYVAIGELKDWFEDTQQNGFKIDGLTKSAGNIPTGNGLEGTKNHFIITAEELISRYKRVLDNPVREEAKRGDFTAMLHYTKLIYFHGRHAPELLQEFETQKESMEHNDERICVNREMFEADAKKYGFKPNQDLIKKGFSVHSKNELYRYPSILLFNISIIAGCKASDSWDTLTLLRNGGVISASIHISLTFLLACACYFRLSTYLYHDSHDDRMSTLSVGSTFKVEEESSVESSTRVGRRWYLPTHLFSIYSEHSVPLKAHISKYCSADILDGIKFEIGPPDWLVKFQTHHYCGRWMDAWKCVLDNVGEQTVIQNPDMVMQRLKSEIANNPQELWQNIKALTYSLTQLREYSAAMEYLKAFLNYFDDSEYLIDQKLRETIIAEVLDESGGCYIYLHQYEIAKREYQRSLDLKKKHLGEMDELIGISYYNLGRCCRIMKHYQNAESHLLSALQIFHNNTSKDPKSDGENSTSSNAVLLALIDTRIPPEKKLTYVNNFSVTLARVIWHLGIMYFELKLYQCAFDYYNKSKVIFQSLYGAKGNHRDIADITYGLGYICDYLKRHSEADGYYKQSVKIISQSFSSGNAKLVDQLATLESNSHTVSGANQYYKFVADAFLNLPGYKVPHPQTAAVIKRFALHMVYMNQYGLAQKLLDKSLAMYESFQKIPYNTDVPSTMAIMALNHWKMGMSDKAIELYTRSLAHLAKVEGKSSQLDAAEILQCLGSIYEEKGQFEVAKDLYLQSNRKYLDALDWCSSVRTHPKILESENQLKGIQIKLQILSKTTE